MLNKKIYLAIIMIFLFISNVVAGEKKISTPQELSEKYKVAHEARDYDAISALINWDGARKPMRKKVEVYTTATFGLKIDNILVEEIIDGKFSKYSMGAKELQPNLPVSHIMKVHFDVDTNDDALKDTVVYLIGKKDADYMISVYVKTGGSSSSSHH